MKLFIVLPLWLILFTNCNSPMKKENTPLNFYDLKAENIKGEFIGMENYRDSVILVVNTASKCGFTPQFAGLEALYQKYKDRGFVILGFPSNQFAKQDPGTNHEILEFCQTNYGVTFSMFAKIEVNGKNVHPIYSYLKSELPGTLGSRIKWNFTKFLISKDGKPVKRFAPTVKPEELESEIEKLLR